MDLPVLPPITYPLESERLLLRPFVAEDFEDLYAFQSLPEVARYLYTGPRDREETRDLLKAWSLGNAFEADDDRLILAMELKDSGRVVGEVLLILRSARHRQGEIGFLLHPDFQGRGLAEEACRPVLRLGFESFGLHRIFGRCDARNTASKRLMERLGLRREAELRENEFVKGEWTTECIFALLADEWAQQAGGGAAG